MATKQTQETEAPGTGAKLKEAEIRRLAYPSFSVFYFACDMNIRNRQGGMCLNTQAEEAGFQSYRAYLKAQLEKSKEKLREEMIAEINEKKFFTDHPLIIPKEILIPTTEGY